MTVASPAVSRDARVIGLIGFAHFLSHFYMLSLVPLFLLVQRDLEVSFVDLGLVITLYNVATAALQTPMGVLVDRFGARRILIAGLFVNAAAVALAGLAQSYGALLALFLLAGAGNSVFHPADYVILTASVEERRQGRAYSIHSFGGALGFAAAPSVMITLAGWTDWRTALVVAGLAGVALSLVFVLSGDTLREGAEARARPRDRIPLRRTLTGPVVLFFLFYMCMAASTIGLTGFAPAFLPTMYGMSLQGANHMLSAMLLANAAGTLLGGPVADRIRDHGLLLTVCFAGAAAATAAIGTAAIPAALVLAAFVANGLFRGVVNPSRDIMVRRMSPAGALGTVFAFVTTGFSIGQALGPLLYGHLMDRGMAPAVLYASAALTLALVGLSVSTGRRRGGRPPGAGVTPA